MVLSVGNNQAIIPYVSQSNFLDSIVARSQANDPLNAKCQTIALARFEENPPVSILPDLKREQRVSVKPSALVVENARNHGIAHALSAFQEFSIENLADSALYLMDKLYPRFKEKIWVFVGTHGIQLFQKLGEHPVKQAEFGIGVTGMLRTESEEKFEWYCEVEKLLLNQHNRSQCSKKYFLIWARLAAEYRNVDEALASLRQGRGTKDEFKKISFTFFERGEFENGTRVMKESPEDGLIEEECFVVLLSRGLSNPALCKAQEFQSSIVRVADTEDKKKIFLNAMCHLKLFDEAIALAQQMTRQEGSLTLLLSIIHWVEHDEQLRNQYLEQLFSFATEIKEYKYGISAFWEEIFKNKFLTDEETLKYAVKVPSPKIRLKIYLNRLYSISCQRLQGLSKKELNSLKELLKCAAKVFYKGRCEWEEFDNFNKIFQIQLEFGFLEDAKETKKIGLEIYDTETADFGAYLHQIGFFCYSGVLEVALNNVKEGAINFKAAYEIQKKLWESHPRSVEFWASLKHVAGQATYYNLGLDAETKAKFKRISRLKEEKIERVEEIFPEFAFSSIENEQ